MNVRIIFPLDQAKVTNQNLALEAMSEGLNRLVNNGAIKGPIDDVLLDYQYQDKTGYAVAELKEGSLIDASKLNEVGAGQCLYDAPLFTLNDDIRKEVEKSFSMASIQDRMRIQQRNPKMRLRYLILDYKRYWQTKLTQMKSNPELVKNVKRLFLSDMNMLMTEVLPYIEEGKQLSMLIGTNQVDPSITNIARDLSLLYRRTLKAIKVQNQIPKSMWSKLTPKYNEFMTHLLLKVFPGIDEILGGKTSGTAPVESEVKTKSYSYMPDGRIKLFD